MSSFFELSRPTSTVTNRARIYVYLIKSIEIERLEGNEFSSFINFYQIGIIQFPEITGYEINKKKLRSVSNKHILEIGRKYPSEISSSFMISFRLEYI